MENEFAAMAAIPRNFVDRRGRDAVAVRYPGDVLTAGELEEQSSRRAWAMKDAGIEAGDWVTLALPNGTVFFEFLFALWKIGAVPHIVSSRLPEAELTGLLELAKPRKVVTQLELAASQAERLAMDFGRTHPRTDALPTVDSTPWKAMSSGGSTGRPKIIVQHLPSRGAASLLRLPTEGAILTTGPLYHNMPLNSSIWALSRGLEVVAMARFDALECLRLIDRYRIRWACLVPTMMRRISQLPSDVISRHDLSSIETLCHTAAPISPTLKREWLDWLGPEKVLELYGGTEGVGLTLINGTDWLSHPGSVGRPVRDEIKIVDDNGSPLPPGEVGEIFSRRPDGSGAGFSYIGSPMHIDDEGFISLGDYGSLDREGYLYIADRRTDMIISGGANIFPAEVESALLGHPDIEDAVVIGLPDDDLGERAHAIVKQRAGSQLLTREQLAEFLAARIVRYKIPRSFEWATENLRDDAGKVRRSGLRAQRLQANPGDN
jgi:bile acid-coenzyme A ligase